RLVKEDFDKPCKDLAVYLLGKILVRKLEFGAVLKGRIVETECYLGGEDKASHSYNGNQEAGAVVLIRSLEVISGTDTMNRFRVTKCKNMNKHIKPTDLCNGPSKLCIAMDITKEKLNKLDISDPYNNEMWLTEDISEMADKEIVVVNTFRIGIGPSAEEWVMKPLRYYILDNKSVSKKR
ncbi:hypothetical protein NQ317_014068, partial [Molorchus minor]